MNQIRRVIDFFSKLNVIYKLLMIFCVFLTLKIPFYIKNRIFFDEGIYIGISKYFISFGSKGYFESIRPFALPLLLAPSQLLNIDSLITGRIISLILVFLCILIVYKIAKDHFNEEAGLFSAYIFATSILVITWGGFLLTDIISYTLGAFSVSLFVKRKYLISGLILGLGFLFRFPVMILAFPILIYSLINLKKKFLNPALMFILGTTLATSPYFIFNLINYQGTLLERLFNPLIEASNIVQTGSWLYQKSSLSILIKDILVYNLIGILAMLFMFKNLKHYKEITLAFTISILGLLTYFSFNVTNYDPRYSIFAVPFIAVLSGFLFSDYIKNKRYLLRLLIVIIILIPGIIIMFLQHKEPVLENDNKLINIIENEDKNLYTNIGLINFYSKSKVNIFPGINLADTYFNYYKDNSSDMLIINPEEYQCHYSQEYCKNDFIKKINYLVGNNNILGCGYLSGTKAIIISKEKSSIISKENCLRSINYEVVSNITKEVLIRINGINLESDGSIINKNKINNLLISNNKPNINFVLLFIPSTNFSTKKIDKINLEEKDFVGIVYTKKDDVEEFYNVLKSNYNNSVIINPSKDVWPEELNLDSNKYEFCIKGNWDNGLTNIPCKGFDMYTTNKEKNILIMKSLKDLKLEYNSIKKSDYEIIIDVPYIMLYDEPSYNIYLEFISEIS